MIDEVVVCSGNYADGLSVEHPRVYLRLDGGGVVCPYCGQCFRSSGCSESADS